VNDDQPLLSVLIVNFNSTPLLEDCLASLEASTIADRMEIIVVDNASTDFELEPMAMAHPSVTFLPQDRNTTCTGGNNIAFEHARADLVLMLNPDTRVEPPAIERAVGHLSVRKDLAGLGAYLIGPDGELQRYYRRLPRLSDLPILLFEPLFRSTARGRRYLMLAEDFNGETVVPQPPGAFLMLRRDALDGKFMEPGYFNFMSDLELCARVSRRGAISVFDDVRCHHVGAAAGIGTTDLGARLRLYQDLTWGVRRYVGAQGISRIGAVAVSSMLVAYWATRVGLTTVRDWHFLPRALITAFAALSGRPPNY
jgi:N-acetylglucosaminyl-diphospho-decaprenol L-rhamnosyltransferase